MRIPLTLRPDPTDDRGLQAWVDAVVDGEPMRLLLDSGAATSALPQVGHSADRPVIGTGTGRGTSGKEGSDPLVQVGSLTVGDLTVTGLTAELLPQDWPHQGRLGLDALSGIWRLDLTDGVLDLLGEAPQALSWQAHLGDRPTVPLEWEATEVNAVWDTGASLTVVDRGWAESHREAVQIGDVAAPGIDSTGTKVPSSDGELLPFSCGGQVIAAGPCAVVDLSGLNQHLKDPIRIILGLPQMLGLQWWFDLPHQRWAVHSEGVRANI